MWKVLKVLDNTMKLLFILPPDTCVILGFQLTKVS